MVSDWWLVVSGLVVSGLMVITVVVHYYLCVYSYCCFLVDVIYCHYINLCVRFCCIGRRDPWVHSIVFE